MKILVSAAALRTSGARTIYRQFIGHLKTHVDGNRYFIMVDKDMEMPQMNGVEYLVVDVSSKLKRLMFDCWGLRALAKKYRLNPDLVISLQNIGLRQFRNVPQVVYYHQPLPFFDYKWNVFKREELLMFCYKHLYPFFVKRSLGERIDMIAQLPSIKSCIVSKYGVPSERVHVLFPDIENIEAEFIASYPYDMGFFHLLYPATNAPYKGHKFLISVLRKLHDSNSAIAQKIRLHLTLDEHTSAKLIREMNEHRVRDNFVFHGILKHDVLLTMYKAADALLFPSVIETLGLPLIEAATFGIPIIACDLKYAHEVLTNYDGASFIEARNADKWATAVYRMCQKRKRFAPIRRLEISSWEQFFDIVESKKQTSK